MLPPDEESPITDPSRSRPGLLVVLVTLLLVLAMLVTLVWPLLRIGPQRRPPPTPTPLYLHEA